MVRYLGNEKAVVQFCHGNAKREAKLSKWYYRTKPSGLRELELSVKPSNEEHKDRIRDLDTDLKEHFTSAPRDLIQVQNAKKRENRWWRGTNDALYNLTKLQGNSIHRY